MLNRASTQNVNDDNNGPYASDRVEFDCVWELRIWHEYAKLSTDFFDGITEEKKQDFSDSPKSIGSFHIVSDINNTADEFNDLLREIDTQVLEEKNQEFIKFHDEEDDALPIAFSYFAPPLLAQKFYNKGILDHTTLNHLLVHEAFTTAAVHKALSDADRTHQKEVIKLKRQHQKELDELAKAQALPLPLPDKILLTIPDEENGTNSNNVTPIPTPLAPQISQVSFYDNNPYALNTSNSMLKLPPKKTHHSVADEKQTNENTNNNTFKNGF